PERAERAAAEPPTEPLRPGEADPLDDHGVTVEHVDVALPEDRRDFRFMAVLEIVIPEDGDHRKVDALELIVLLEKNYGIKIDNPEEGRKVFHSVGSMARYIAQHRK
ncbi:MAG: hypothetical protein KY428_09230, partial [Bacteroidetes bacterium]|nr:hypothetical protein [Bacteroidota bacterium]